MDFIDIITNEDLTQAVVIVGGKVVYEGFMNVNSEESQMLICVLSNLENATTRCTKLPRNTLEGIDLVDLMTDDGVVEIFQIGGLSRLSLELEESDGEGEE